jgi:peptidoglycan DL-endopeptidase CwlO
VKKIAFTAILALLLLSAGCGGKGEKSSSDNRMGDPGILQNDSDLRIGDSGINDSRGSGAAPASGSSFRIMGTGLVRTYPNPNIAPVNGSYANNVISFGELFLGTPYEYGSDRNNPNTFDCSDFTRYSFLGALGMELPIDSRSQANYVYTFGTRQYWDLSQAQRGDLLFFMDYRGPRQEDYRYVNRANERITHVGIYMGDGMLLHTASQATGGVRTDYIFGKHLEWRFISGGSVLP